MNEVPEYSASEFVLSGLCFALAVSGWLLDRYFG
jgi:hypothetical protein